MTTTYYAIPCPEQLLANFRQLANNLDERVAASQAPLLIQVANQYTDVVVDVMVLGNSQLLPSDSMSRRILEGVASVIKTAAHTLTKQVLHKMTNAEMAPLAAQIRARQLVINNQSYISFPLPADLAARYHYCFKAIKAGDVSVQTEFMEAILTFSQLANHYFYQESVRPLKLGMITRKLADLGGVSINKASQAAIRKLIPQLTLTELQGFVEYLEPLFQEVVTDAK